MSKLEFIDEEPTLTTMTYYAGLKAGWRWDTGEDGDHEMGLFDSRREAKAKARKAVKCNCEDCKKN